MDLIRAINQILPALGEHPVTSVDAKHPTVAVIVRNLLNQIDMTLSEGWWFNEYANELFPSAEGEIALPLNTLAVVPTDPNCYGVQRNGRLYNRTTRSFKWPVGQAVPVIITERLEFEELPETAAQFVLYTSLITSYMDDIGLEQVVREWQSLAAKALNSMEAEHLRNQRYSTRRTRRYRRYRRAIGGY